MIRKFNITIDTVYYDSQENFYQLLIVKLPPKALYQHIVAKNRNRDVVCIFLGQENGNVCIRDPYITFILLRAKCH